MKLVVKIIIFVAVTIILYLNYNLVGLINWLDLFEILVYLVGWLGLNRSNFIFSYNLYIRYQSFE